jgi:hypothetical protein
MWGFMAGDDHVKGTVDVLNGANSAVDSFEVSASYALGGLGGGQDSARMNYLYEAFSKETANALLNTPEGPQVTGALTPNTLPKN